MKRGVGRAPKQNVRAETVPLADSGNRLGLRPEFLMGNLDVFAGDEPPALHPTHFRDLIGLEIDRSVFRAIQGQIRKKGADLHVLARGVVELNVALLKRSFT